MMLTIAAAEEPTETETETESETETETGDGGAQPTEIPDGDAATGIAAPMTLVLAAIAGLLMFN
jgi:hypothetical protein